MNLTPFILISALVALNVCYVQGESCKTPSGADGRCISQIYCGDAVLMATDNNQNCGLDQHGPKVCCPPSPKNVPSRTKRESCTMTAALPDPDSLCCGQSPVSDSKIVRSFETEIDQYPWLALIEYIKNDRIKLICTGSLISGRHVLTAGHCVTGSFLKEGTPKNVRLGEYDTSNDGKDCITFPSGDTDCTDGVTVIPIETITVHPQYVSNDNKKGNDIALLKLKELAPYTDFIRPICLPTTDVTGSPPERILLTAAGWGTVNFGNEIVSMSEKKLDVNLPFVPLAECQAAYITPPRNITLSQGQLCAGGDGKDFCRGNAGGPLVYKNGEHFDLVGITSFGPAACGKDNTPGVYTKVFEYNSWIRGLIG